LRIDNDQIKQHAIFITALCEKKPQVCLSLSNVVDGQPPTIVERVQGKENYQLFFDGFDEGRYGNTRAFQV